MRRRKGTRDVARSVARPRCVRRAALAAGPIQFSHDRRIADPSPMYMCEEQVHSLLHFLKLGILDFDQLATTNDG